MIYLISVDSNDIDMPQGRGIGAFSDGGCESPDF